MDQEFEQVVAVGKSLIEEQDAYQKKNSELFEKMKENYNYIAKLHEREAKRVKNDIQGLIDSQEELEAEPAKKTDISEMTKQEQQLKQEIAVVKQHQEELSSHCQKLESLKGQLKEEHSKLVDEKERLENETTVMLPMKREAISLYTSISRIRWDFEGSKDELKGYISNKNEVTPFCFDKRKCSQFSITNALWDSMKSD